MGGGTSLCVGAGGTEDAMMASAPQPAACALTENFQEFSLLAKSKYNHGKIAVCSVLGSVRALTGVNADSSIYVFALHDDKQMLHSGL